MDMHYFSAHFSLFMCYNMWDSNNWSAVPPKGWHGDYMERHIIYKKLSLLGTIIHTYSLRSLKSPSGIKNETGPRLHCLNLFFREITFNKFVYFVSKCCSLIINRENIIII